MSIMNEVEYVPLVKFEIEPSLCDKFWNEKVKRSIQECDSVSTLKEMAILLTQIATQRQAVIRGLVKDLFVMKGITVDPNDLTNPLIESLEGKS